MWSVIISLQVGNGRTSPWGIDLRVFGLLSFKHHKSGQGLVCRWGHQFSSKLDVDSFALLKISILDLAWDILDVESAPILGPARKSCFIYVGDFCHRFGKFDSNFPATTDRIDNLKIEPHFKVGGHCWISCVTALSCETAGPGLVDRCLRIWLNWDETQRTC